MIYIKNNGESLEKYTVTLDTESIKELKERIIKDCSLIIHKAFHSDHVPTFSRNSIIKNLKLVGPQNNYLYSYDEYIPPLLVSLINRLLDNDETVIQELVDYSPLNESSLDRNINSVNKQLAELSEDDYIKKNLLLIKLERLLKLKKKNINQKSTKEYYEELQNYISLDLVSTLSLDDLLRVESFYKTAINNPKKTRKK